MPSQVSVIGNLYLSVLYINWVFRMFRFFGGIIDGYRMLINSTLHRHGRLGERYGPGQAEKLVSGVVCITIVL